MKRFRLKKEAVPYFNSELATTIQRFDIWQKNNVDINALEEVQDLYISYGHKSSESVKNLCGWDKDGTRMLFTIHFPSVKFHEHDEFSKGKIVRELMNRIQIHIDDFYSQFINETI